MDLASNMSLALGSSWASGLNLYASVAALGFLSHGNHIELPESLAVIGHPVVIGVTLSLYAIEFFADKIPFVDTAWDLVHSFIRIPAGAVLAAASFYDVSLPYAVAAGLIGGGVSASSHVTSTTARAAINTSPEPVSNITASITKDTLTLGSIWSALNYPWLFFSLFGLWVLGVVYFYVRVRSYFYRDKKKL